MGFIDNFRDWTRKQRAPFTVFLIASIIAAALFFSAGSRSAAILFAIRPGQPWGCLTYPWAFGALGNGGGVLFLAFMFLWLYQVGSGLEREMNTLRFAIFWFAATALFGVVMAVGASAMNVAAVNAGPMLPISALTVAWCVRNRSAVVMLFGIIPLSATILGWITAVIILMMFAGASPFLGIAGCLPLALLYFFASDQIPGLPFSSGGRVSGRRISPKQKEATTRGQVQYDQSYFDEVKRRETERAERERLKKLLGEDEP